MAIGFVNATSAGVTPAGSPLTLTVPTGTVDGHVMIAVLSVDAGTSTAITGPTGSTWTLRTNLDRTTTIKCQIWHRVASGETAGTTTYQWSASPNALMSGIILTYSGVDTTTPFDVASVTNTGSSQSVDSATNGVTTVTDGAVALLVGAVQSATATTTPPANYAEEAEVSTGRICFADDKTISPAGSTGTQSAAMSGGVNKPWASIMTALRPATGGTPTGFMTTNTGYWGT